MIKNNLSQIADDFKIKSCSKKGTIVITPIYRRPGYCGSLTHNLFAARLALIIEKYWDEEFPNDGRSAAKRQE